MGGGPRLNGGPRRRRLAALGLVLGAVLVLADPAQADSGPPRLVGDPAQPGDLASSIHDLTGEIHDLAPDTSIHELTGEIRDLALSTESLDGTVGVSTAGQSTTVTLTTDVLFAFAKADLTPAARTRIGQAAQALRTAGATGTVEVSGHTDHVGTAAANQDLSQRRARAVVAALTPLVTGLKVTLTPRGYGFTRPVAQERTVAGADDPAGRARNRRVEITFAAPGALG